MPRRDFLPLVAVLVTVVLAGAARARVCYSTDVRKIENLEALRGCSMIMGNLRIMFFEIALNETEYNRYVFPELTEITGYLLTYRLFSLVSLGDLFPNLRVIRGYELYKDYALIIFRMEQLTEIGLPNLIHIGRGGVVVDHCQNLCYVTTVNWTAIGTSLTYYSTNPNCPEYCPRECPGGCWSNRECQKANDNKCHSECVDCTKADSSKHCKVCKQWKNDDDCVPKCPQSKYKFHVSMRCVTKEECSTFWHGRGWTYNGSCIDSCPTSTEYDSSVEGNCKYCGDDCVKVCPGVVVDNLASLQSLSTCTHINGSLEIKLPRTSYPRKLEPYFGRITEISGHLKIGRSGIKSLQFLSSLRLIKGERELENERFSLVVYENMNLERLFDFNSNFSLRILRGSISFNGNPQLCMSEIESFIESTKIKISEDEKTVLRNSNGYKSVCHTRDIAVNLTNLTSNHANITWDTFDKDVTTIAYTIYFIETRVNITAFDSADTCDMRWDSFLVQLRNWVELFNLKPYTRYGFYIESYSTTKQNFQSRIHYFRTKEDDPSEPQDFEVSAVDENTLKLSWSPPKYPSGKLAYYEVWYTLQPDYLPMILERNYCLNRHVQTSNEVSIIESPVNNTNPNCTCEVTNEIRFMQHGSTSFCGESDKSSCRFLQYEVSESEFAKNTTEEPPHETMKPPMTLTKNDTIPNTAGTNVLRIDNGRATEHDVKYLKHYSLYIFFLKACNREQGPDGVDHCSPVVMGSERTKPSEAADEIPQVKVKNEGNGVKVSWLVPTKPNSAIVAYDIEHKRIDGEHSKASTECIEKKKHDSVVDTYIIASLLPGRYSLRVRAVSYAGPGKYSEPAEFVIDSPSSKTWIYVLVTVLIVVSSAIGVTGYFYWKKKHSLDNVHLIASINPDYAGPAYIEDEWEIERSDVEILEELGQGSFGMVYKGVIRSRNYSCAIKTVNEGASLISRHEFLHEGSIMKGFNDAHHVVKLLGIVSRGQPPLVIMELMERGDLKSYLRRSREPSQNLTSNETYRMAANIADGMAYLSAKKFVHRDLAARNCMVAADHTVKIGDFGMARDVYETDYYRKDTSGLLPVRWMAPESLSDGVFTTDSDVWSYGVVLWEMATKAEQPYQGLSNEEVFHSVKNKGVLERPPECSDLLYEVMSACWMWRPIDRPTFRDIVEKLSDHVGETFKLVAFCYSRQGREHSLSAGPRPINPPALLTIPTDDDGPDDQHEDAGEEEVEPLVELFAGGESGRSARYHQPSTSRQEPSTSRQRPVKKTSPFKLKAGTPSSSP